MTPFLADDAPDAYERLIDRLLASPRYGQRWGRHWLDLVRYAESDGYRQDAYRPDAWRYRDYVVRCVQRRQALRPVPHRATRRRRDRSRRPRAASRRPAILRLGTYEYNQRDVRGQWADILNDITDVTGEVFLGLGIGCARCHDHKFDPILQKDYYRLQAFFTPLLAPRRPDAGAIARVGRLSVEACGLGESGGRRPPSDSTRSKRPYRDRGSGDGDGQVPRRHPGDPCASPRGDRTPLERQLGALAYRQIKFEHDQVPALLKGEDEDAMGRAQEGSWSSFDSLCGRCRRHRC